MKGFDEQVAMHEISPRDHGLTIDWGKTARDYAEYRTGYPESFFQRITALGIGVSGQRILDLGTGTGLLARALARRGCVVTGVDLAAPQIEAAENLARRDGLEIDFRIAAAEQTGMPDAAFDVIVASQCWLYFDRPRMIAEVRRLLRPAGRLMTCHMCWLPREDPIARGSEQLILAHNPAWSAGDWSGHVPPMPAWAEDEFELLAMFQYDEPIPFTRKTWRGRLRACRGIGATLTPEQVRSFDEEHARLLARTTAETFTILHRIDAHILRLCPKTTPAP